MIKRIYLIIGLVIFFCTSSVLLNCEKPKYNIINIDGKIIKFKIYKEYFYFLDGSTNSIHRFNNNFKLINKIGSIGKGPGEATRYSRITFVKDIIQLESYGKISLFKLDGTFIKDIKSQKVSIILNNDNILFQKTSFVNNKNMKAKLYQIVLFNSNFKRILMMEKKLVPVKSGYQFNAFLTPVNMLYNSMQKKIYVSYPLGEKIVSIYNEKGERLGSIMNIKNNIIVSDEFKKEFFSDILSDPRFKNNSSMADFMHKATYFPKYFPQFQGVFVDDKGYIYIKTYKRKGGKVFVNKYNQIGKFIKKYLLPDKGISISNANNFTAFTNTHYYYLYENQDGDYIMYSEKLN